MNFNNQPFALAFQLFRIHFFKLLLCGLLLSALSFAGTFLIVSMFPFDFSYPDKWIRSQLNIAILTLVLRCLIFSLIGWIVIVIVSKSTSKNLPSLLSMAFWIALISTITYLLASLKPVVDLWLGVEYSLVSLVMYIPLLYIFVRLSGAFGWACDKQAGTFSFFRENWYQTKDNEPAVFALWLVIGAVLVLIFAVIFTLQNVLGTMYSDRSFGTTFFTPAQPEPFSVRMQHFFWFFKHTEVQIQLIFYISFGFLITASYAVYNSTNLE